MKSNPFGLIAKLFLLLSSCTTMTVAAKAADRPNILWLVSEDNSPYLGCYGDTFATTPHLDNLAKQGVLYENAFANAPVCAAARCTLITGMHAASLGTLHMRSGYAIPDQFKTYPEYLREAGYYCINAGKRDYNHAMDKKAPSIWSEEGKDAHYRSNSKIQPGQPFFAVFNVGQSHESSIHRTMTELRHDPAEVTLPPYHPDTPEIRHDWAQYYDKVEEMDTIMGTYLKELDESGLAENTIVFYYSDHGGVLTRSKRFLYDTGTRVPLIIRFPKKYRHLAPAAPGTKTDRLVSFVDFAPTLLSLAEGEIPSHFQGRAFLGKRDTQPREYVELFRGRMDERYDLMRAVVDKQYRYIHNFMPHRIYGQYLRYLWRAPVTRSWEAEYKAGHCNEAQRIFWEKKPTEELYDVTKDPWEVNNLAGDPKYKDVLERMRNATHDWVLDIRDPSFLQEGEMITRSEGSTSYELARQKDFPLERIVETAEIASTQNVENLPALRERMTDPDSGVRFWAVLGCSMLKEKAAPAKSDLMTALQDSSPDVRIAAAELLYHLDEKTIAYDLIIKELSNPNGKVTLHAINVLHEWGEEECRKALPVLKSLKKPDGYTGRCIERLLNLYAEEE